MLPLLSARISTLEKVLDAADIVRDGIFRQLPARFPISELPTIRPLAGIEVESDLGGEKAECGEA